MKILYSLALWAMIALPPVHADEYDEAINLIKDGKYPVAEVLLKAHLAKNGDTVRTHFALGYSAEQQDKKEAAYEHYLAAIATNRRTNEDAKTMDRAYDRLFAMYPEVKTVFQKARELELAASAAATKEEQRYLNGAAQSLYRYALRSVEAREAPAPADAPPVGDAPPPVAAVRMPNQPEIERTLGYELKRHKAGAKRMGPNGHWYKYFDDHMSWSEAQQECRKMGGYLATITSKEENDFIADLSDGPFHVGGTDEGSDGQWRWITGEPFIYFAWDITEPNGRDREYRLQFLSTDHNPNRANPAARWNDINDGDGAGFVCEWHD